MTEREYTEFYNFLRRIETKVDTIEDKVSNLPCKVNTYQLNLHQKIIFGAIALILVAFMGYLIPWNKPNKGTTLSSSKVGLFNRVPQAGIELPVIK